MNHHAQTDSGTISSQAASGGSVAIGGNAGNVYINNQTVQYMAARFAPTSAELAATEAKLAALPLNVPIPRDDLSPGSRMRYGRNPYFVGREADLLYLATSLKARQTVAITTGTGGMGKSQLAAKFAYRYGRYFAGGVFWLSMADPANVPAEIAQCGRADALNLDPAFDTHDLPTQVSMVLGAWKTALPRLLIFDNCDNCEEEALLEQWRPVSGGCRILVTSRHAG